MKFTHLALALAGLAACTWHVRGDDPASPQNGQQQNWHQWRGPEATGVAPLGNPPVEWSEEKNIKWKVEVPGSGDSSPIVWGDQVFVLTAIKTDRKADPPKPAADAKPAAPAADQAKPDAPKPDEAKAESPKTDPAKSDAPKSDAPKSDAAKTDAPKSDAPKSPTDRPGFVRPGSDRPGFGRGGDRPGGFGGGRGGGFMRTSTPTNYYEFVVISYDRNTGKERWRQIAAEAVPHEGHHPDGSFASSSAMTDGQRIYASFGSRGVFCYDLAGKPLWKRDLGRMQIYNSFGEGTSPVIVGDSLVVNWDHQGDSFLYCLDAKTGEIRWKVPRDQQTTWATPLVVEHKGRTQVIINGSKRTRSYDLKNGDLIWECGGQVASCIPCPVALDGVVYCMTGFRGSALLAIPLDAAGDITDTDKVAWKKDQGTPYVPSPLLYGDMLYFNGSNSSALSCLNARTGEPVFDRQRIPGLSNIYASPVGAADRVYYTGRDGVTVVLKRGEEMEVLATNKLAERVDASAAIAGNQLFMRGDKSLYCFQEASRGE